jgi:hypothetical protein
VFQFDLWEVSYNVVMRRCLSIATLSFFLMALPAWGQGRGGGAHFASQGGGAHFSSHSGSGHNGSGIHSSSSSSGRFHGSFGRTSGVRIRTGNHGHRGFNGRRGYYPYYPYATYYPYGYGWYDDSLAYDTADRDQDSYAAYQAPSYPAPNAENNGLQRDVQTLHGKVDRLQADVDARNRPEPGPEPETALVFRDQHVEEVRNYAISGGAVWVLNAQAAKKIPLVNLDIEATVKMNEDRGVDFQVPEPALQIMIVR